MNFADLPKVCGVVTTRGKHVIAFTWYYDANEACHIAKTVRNCDHRLQSRAIFTEASTVKMFKSIMTADVKPKSLKQMSLDALLNESTNITVVAYDE